MKKDWLGKKVVILGAARQGIALARYLAAHAAMVVLSDRQPASEFSAAQDDLIDIPGAVHPIQWVCGGHPLSLLEDTDLLCLSGGVPPTIPIATAAMSQDIPLSNDSQIFLEAAPCLLIGITGSAGKSTTTALVGNIAEQALRNSVQEERIASNGKRPAKVWVGGNIGAPLIAVIDEMDANDIAVMELSSFQLELMHHSPGIAALLNVTPNHLDRHGSMEVYGAIKARILDFQSSSNVAVLGRDDPLAWSMQVHVRGRLITFGMHPLTDDQDGTYVNNDTLFLQVKNDAGKSEILPLMSKDDIRLRGEHNLLNVLAACAIGHAAGLPVGAMRSGVMQFAGMPHRLEFVRTWNGADWYNDSIATAPERTVAAIRSFDEPLVLLAGGRDKNLPWEVLAECVQQRVDHLVVFGEAAEKIIRAVEMAATSTVLGSQYGGPTNTHAENSIPSITSCTNLTDAVHAASQIIQPGDVVLLSPGGTSFDEFNDFEERGECFVRLVKDLP